jgi:hypothetical protein
LSSGRAIVWSHNCDIAAEKLGGYRCIDEPLIAVLDALDRNPYAAPKIDIDWCSARYIPTLAKGDAPDLIWLFYIEANGTVVIDHVEALEKYLPPLGNGSF